MLVLTKASIGTKVQLEIRNWSYKFGTSNQRSFLTFDILLDGLKSLPCQLIYLHDTLSQYKLLFGWGNSKTLTTWRVSFLPGTALQSKTLLIFLSLLCSFTVR